MLWRSSYGSLLRTCFKLNYTNQTVVLHYNYAQKALTHCQWGWLQDKQKMLTVHLFSIIFERFVVDTFRRVRWKALLRLCHQTFQTLKKGKQLRYKQTLLRLLALLANEHQCRQMKALNFEDKFRFFPSRSVVHSSFIKYWPRVERHCYCWLWGTIITILLIYFSVYVDVWLLASFSHWQSMVNW